MTTQTRNTAPILIFLDIDGVLLPFPNSEESTCGSIFPDDCLASLSDILQAFPTSRIILSSTWRAQPNLIAEILDSFDLYAKAKGGTLLDVKQFADLTDTNYHTERQHEIYKYLFHDNREKVAAWVALDDEELLEGEVNAKYRTHFEGHAVKVNSRTGLTARDASIAIQLIQHQLDRYR